MDKIATSFMIKLAYYATARPEKDKARFAKFAELLIQSKLE